LGEKGLLARRRETREAATRILEDSMTLLNATVNFSPFHNSCLSYTRAIPVLATAAALRGCSAKRGTKIVGTAAL
ncbi:hypothetical protein PENTCL1PPCAC_7129, partial [Pristionchus entomophagus]